ncbi:MAG: DUF4281 domain-containing protein [Rubrivivax sp.]|nr:DUF4281 domain-containing protein [Rubrivivax sp.]
MSEAMFSAASLVAIFAWVGLGLAVLVRPGRLRASLLALVGRAVPTGLCVLYAYVLVAHWGTAPGGGFSSLAAVMNLFSVPGKMLGGWVHFLAFDLLVGRWIADDVLASGRARALLLVALPATFMYGPLGLLLYLLARSALRAPTLDEAR